ncbi:TPA: hypothetical protein ACHGZC_003629 [Escherichia coli]
MAGTNDFKAFATDTDANVTSQEEWEALTALKKGFSSGKASSAQVSKALRQPSTMAAVLGQFIANAELDALDDGDVDGLVAKLATAITTNLGLGTAAKKNIGTRSGQVPDMSSFASSFAQNGYQKLPSGLIIQWGYSNVASTAAGASANNTVTVTYPVAFPNTTAQVLAAYDNTSTLVKAIFSTDTFTKTTFQASSFALTYTAATPTYGQRETSFRWIAIGY